MSSHGLLDAIFIKETEKAIIKKLSYFTSRSLLSSQCWSDILYLSYKLLTYLILMSYNIYDMSINIHLNASFSSYRVVSSSSSFMNLDESSKKSRNNIELSRFYRSFSVLARTFEFQLSTDSESKLSGSSFWVLFSIFVS